MTPEERDRERARGREKYRASLERPGHREVLRARALARRLALSPDQRERMLQRMRVSGMSPAQQVAERQRRRRIAATPEYRAQERDRNLRKKYGITAAQKQAMLAQQGGACAACGSKTPGARDWHVDHDHATGRVRGVLCRRCNMVLGLLGDTLELVDSAVRGLVGYLQRCSVPT